MNEVETLLQQLGIDENLVPHSRELAGREIPEVLIGRFEKFISVGKIVNGVAIVPYRQGSISYLELEHNEPAISFEFSGCAMAKFTYQRRTFVAHICLTEDAYDCREAWNRFINDDGVTDVRLIFPASKALLDGRSALIKERNWSISEEVTTICGVILPDGRCYSALIEPGTKRVVKVETHGPHMTKAAAAIGLKKVPTGTSSGLSDTDTDCCRIV